MKGNTDAIHVVIGLIVVVGTAMVVVMSVVDPATNMVSTSANDSANYTSNNTSKAACQFNCKKQYPSQGADYIACIQNNDCGS